ncbi:MAG TPA: hypothetical protein VGK00_16340 [Anaerolineales bacterium]|jgi:hypothetical protein
MKSKLRYFNKFNPAVNKNWLYLLAGALWLGVGSMLTMIASRWLSPMAFVPEVLVILSGLISAAIIYYFGFSKLAKKNIQRISAYAREKVCLFAFQEWKSYPLVASMISLGVYLRVYSPFPKPMLAVLYLGIGGGLFFASLHYFFHVLNIFKANV